ncbi:hypothetical protein PG994_012295 [Apiospora phragmitis]|uniref:TipA protein n=1 Tax=Apiospora phragmitis TaxID=2905665 RepID=A0ABR1TVA3_9PEZI
MATNSHTQGRFAITTRKLPISKSAPIAAMEARLGIPVPEMIFGDNVVAVRHAPTGWRIEFNAYDALDAVDKTDKNMLQVAYAKSWSASREQTSAGIKEVVKPYDWSYSTTYRGTTTPPSSTNTSDGENNETPNLTPVGPAEDDPTRPAKQIPLELLKRRDPILFFDDVVLYESELDDNGISMLSVKTRVHEHRMLLLCRLFMRLDHVVARVRDTRVYVDFDTDEVIREYTVKEGSYEDLKKAFRVSGLTPDGVTVALRDGNKVAEQLPIIDQTIEHVSLK